MSGKPEEKGTPQTPTTKKTALALLLEQGNGGEATTKEIVQAIMTGSGLVFSPSEVRRYVQASGRKVKKYADGLLAIGVNVAFLRTLTKALQNAGLTITIGDALNIVRSEFGVEIPPDVIMILELASS